MLFRYRLVLNIFLFAVAQLVVCTVGCAAGSAALKAKTFLGPAPGVRYFYEDAAGAVMVLEGLAWEGEGTLLIEQMTIFPTSTMCLDICDESVTEAHEVHVDGERLMRREFPLNGPVVDKTLFDLGERAWSNPVALLLKEKDGNRLTHGRSRCRLNEIPSQVLFGKQRTVLQVQGEHCVFRKYASGIGLIQEAGMKLTRIEVGGKAVANY